MTVRTRSRALQLTAFGLVSVAWLHPFLTEAFLSRGAYADRGIFITMSRFIAGGAVPYLQVYDHKQPMIHLLGAVAWGVSPSIRSVYRMEQFAVLLLAGLLFTMLRSGFRLRLVPSLAGLSFGLIALRNPLVLEGGHLTEEYAILFLTATIIAWCHMAHAVGEGRRQAAAAWATTAGAMAMLTLLTRESFALALGALAVSFHLRLRLGQGLRPLLASELLGVSLPWLTWIAYLWHAGAIASYLEVFSDNFGYAAATSAAGFASTLARAAETLLEKVFAGNRWTAAGVALGGAATLLLASLRGPNGPLPFLLPLWFLGELIAAAAPNRPYGHYFIPFVPFWTVLGGYLTELLLPTRLGGAKHVLRGGLAAIVLTAGAWGFDQGFRQHGGNPLSLWGMPSLPALPETLQQRLQAEIGEQELRTYVPLTANGTAFWLEMPLPIGTRFFYQFPWLFRELDSPRVAELLADLAAADLLVVNRNRWRLHPDIEREIAAIVRSRFQFAFESPPHAFFLHRAGTKR